MKNNNLLKMCLGVIMLSVFISSCADDFTEEDLLNAQYDLQQQKENASDSANINALNKAGEFMDYAVTVTTDDAPVQGVVISATNQAGETLSDSTNSNGTVTFTDIHMGGHTISMKSANHVDLSYLIDFGSPENGVNYQIVNGKIVPIKTSEGTKIQAIPLNGMLTGTIEGKVTIETDLTNNGFEVPQNISVRANLGPVSGLVNSTNNNGNNNASYNNSIISNVTFTQANIGSAEVDNATGRYKMTVPSVPGLGLSYNLVVPNLELPQTLAFSEVNGEDVGVQIGTQTALYGAGANSTNYPTGISGVKAVFSEPDAEGNGFTLTGLAPYKRGLPTNTYSYPVSTSSNMRVRLTQGVGYQSSPVVTLTGGNSASDENATAKVGMEFKSTGTIAINAPGTGYTVGENVNIYVRRVYGGGSNSNIGVTTLGAIITSVNGSGGITGINYDPFPTNSLFWDQYVNLGTLDVASIGGFENTFGGGADATFTIGYTGRINDIVFTESGEGYTSEPTITLTGGSPSSAATVVVEEMAFQYEWMPSATVTTPYVLLPEISFVGTGIYGDIDETTGTGYKNANGDFKVGAATVEDHLKVNADGTIGIHSDVYTTLIAGVTDAYFVEEPQVLVKNEKHIQAEATVDVNASGEITGLTVENAGKGYSSIVTLTLETLTGLNGNGANIALSGFSTSTSDIEMAWDGSYNVLSGGSNYKGNVNTVIKGYSMPNSFIAPTNGASSIVNIDYGKGNYVNDVN